MPTHSEIAAQLLRDAASFFRSIAEQNEGMNEQMSENAAVFEEVAALVENDPLGEINAHGHSHEGGGCCGGGGHHHHDDDEDSCCSTKKEEKKGGCCGGNGGCN